MAKTDSRKPFQKTLAECDLRQLGKKNGPLPVFKKNIYVKANLELTPLSRNCKAEDPLRPEA